VSPFRRRGVPAALLVGALLVSCASPEREVRLLDVPFLEQPPDRCGTASVAMVARFYGISPDMEALDRDIHIPALAGSIPALLAEGARRQGLDAEVRRCTEGEVHALISDGFPLIVMLAPAGREPRGHFVVATGSNPQTGALRIHSGSQKDRWISSGHWRKRWKKAGCQIVLLRPA
jgi:ABC-type bacteriocin/lantibiotic exporter with double-glycine peptidase domain